MTLTKLMGLIISTLDTIQWVRFHSRVLQQFLRPFQVFITQKRDMQLQVPWKVKLSLVWWTKISNLTKGKVFWIPNRVQVFTDASLQGWGATCEDLFFQGVWTEKESHMHINLLELRAIYLALTHLSHLLKGRHVLIRTDNISAKAYVNKQGGSKSLLNKEALKIMQWAEANVLSMRAEHVQGIVNIQADWLSRTRIQEAEWALNRGIFQRIAEVFGQPILDL